MAAVALAVTVSAAGCASSEPQDDDRASILAAFYPLQFAAQEVGGDAVRVESLTPPGTEPHDVELTPQQVAAVADADLILYVKGFQPAVDAAVEAEAGDRAVDVSAGIDLLSGGAGEGDGDSATDPHIWLDPTNMITIGDEIADRLTQIRPEDGKSFAAASADLDRRLEELDSQWSRGTEDCRSRDLVVSHEAFGYLADRYGLRQIGISGLSPESEPNPAQVARIADYVRSNDVQTVYYETLVDPKVARTVAEEAGARTAVLDPLEALPEGSTQDYLSVMRDNLAAVQEGQPCP
jgi:zinc transport system substrate-binding protein